MPVYEGEDEGTDVIDFIEGWSMCNDDLYRIANQLLSLVYANKYFGDNSNRDDLLNICESFYKEFTSLEDKVERRPNFNYEKVYKLLVKVVKAEVDSQENEDVLVEEDKSNLFGTCPISRRPITHPVSQRFTVAEDTCDHVFDHTSITDLIRSSKSTCVNCPVAACNKKVYESLLHRDWESVHWRRHQEYLRNIDQAGGQFSGATLFL